MSKQCFEDSVPTWVARMEAGANASPTDLHEATLRLRSPLVAPRIVKTIAKQQSSAIILDDKAQLLADIEHLKTQVGRMATALDRVYDKALQLTVKE